MDLSYTRAALTYVGYICEVIRENHPHLYEENLFGRLDYFVNALDDKTTLEHLSHDARIHFLSDLDAWCVKMSQTLESITPKEGDKIH